MSACPEILAALNDALDGEPLEPAVERDVAVHLDGCAACARVARELSSIHRLIFEERAETFGKAAAPARPPRRPHRRRPSQESPWMVPALAAAAALLAVVLLADVTASRPRPARIGEARSRTAEPPPRPTEAPKPPDPRAEEAPARPREEAPKEPPRQERKIPEAEIPRPAAETPEKPKPALPEERRPSPTVTEVFIATVERAERARLADGSPLQANQGISAGQGIDVGPAGAAVVVFPDGTRLELGPETDVKAFKAKVHVARGAVKAVIARQPKDQPMIFSTPHGEAKVLGTTLTLTVHPDPAIGARLDVAEGKVELRNQHTGRKVEVAAGHYAVAAAGTDLVARPVPRTAAQAVLDSRGSVTIKFGPAGQALPAGVLGDAGETFDAERGYGWQGPVAKLPVISNMGVNPPSRQAVARAPGQGLKGSLIFAGWKGQPVTWSMAVPNGRYWITVCAGDPTDGALSHVNVEGLQAIDAAVTVPGQYVEPADLPIVVRDGAITMIVGGQQSNKASAQGCSDTHLQYVIIRRDAPKK